jgi:hypothetical protein
MMKNLLIGETECTPNIRFDAEKETLEIRGSSYPENISEFYSPIFFWLEEYLRHLYNKTVIVNLEPVCFNDNSWKVLMGFLEILDSATAKGGSICVSWLYGNSEEDVLRHGEKFQEEFPRIAFTFVRKSCDIK